MFLKPCHGDPSPGSLPAPAPPAGNPRLRQASVPAASRPFPGATGVVRLPEPRPGSAAGVRSANLSPKARVGRAFPRRPVTEGYLVDPASSICLSQRLSHASLSTHGRYSETANGSLNQLWFL